MTVGVGRVITACHQSDYSSRWDYCSLPGAESGKTDLTPAETRGSINITKHNAGRTSGRKRGSSVCAAAAAGCWEKKQAGMLEFRKKNGFGDILAGKM